jgi:hypothetical protein
VLLDTFGVRERRVAARYGKDLAETIFTWVISFHPGASLHSHPGDNWRAHVQHWTFVAFGLFSSSVVKHKNDDELIMQLEIGQYSLPGNLTPTKRTKSQESGT